MTKELVAVRAFLGFALLLSWALLIPAWAQHVPEDEYKDLIRVSQDIQPLGDTPFGENISLYNGSLSFEQTDVSLAGNGPLLALTRSYSLQGSEYYAGRSGYAFGDWIIALPRIETLAVLGPENSIRDGWMVDSPTGDAYQRCSYFSAPPDYTVQPGFTAP